MTDRLKAWLDEPYSEMSVSEIDTRNFEALAALRAVVELHRGQESTYGVGYTSQQERIVMCVGCDEEWPCETIRTIEKEVFGAE